MTRPSRLPARRVARPVAAVLAALSAGCAPGTDNFGTTQSIRVQERRPEGFAAWTDAPAPYRLGPGDRVRVAFLLTPEVSETVLVAPDGTVSLRVAGRVELAGRRTDEAERAVAAAARRTLTNPIVTVAVEEAGAALAFVGGQVRRAGAYPLAGRRGIAEVIALAGGLEDAARMDQIVLVRRSPDDLPMLRTVDLQAFFSGDSAAADIPLAAGDIVFVPRTRIGEVGLLVEQLTRSIPFNRSFGYAINQNTPGRFF